jgi:hypothetical protein
MRDLSSAIQEVRSGTAQIACLLKPTSVEQVANISFGGGVMPRSPDFYPKLLSGLTIFKLQDETEMVFTKCSIPVASNQGRGRDPYQPFPPRIPRSVHALSSKLFGRNDGNLAGSHGISFRNDASRRVDKLGL